MSTCPSDCCDEAALQVVDDRTALDERGRTSSQAGLPSDPTRSWSRPSAIRPLGIYAELGRRVRDGRVDTTRVTLAQLDAYLGISQDDPRSLYAWLCGRRRLARIPADRVLRLAVTHPSPRRPHA